MAWLTPTRRTTGPRVGVTTLTGSPASSPAPTPPLLGVVRVAYPQHPGRACTGLRRAGLRSATVPAHRTSRHRAGGEPWLGTALPAGPAPGRGPGQLLADSRLRGDRREPGGRGTP